MAHRVNAFAWLAVVFGSLSQLPMIQADRQIWSQGESEYNHYWFACYDHPNDFFTSELTATVEKPLSVVSNGKLVNTKENKDGTRMSPAAYNALVKLFGSRSWRDTLKASALSGLGALGDKRAMEIAFRPPKRKSAAIQKGSATTSGKYWQGSRAFSQFSPRRLCRQLIG